MIEADTVMTGEAITEPALRRLVEEFYTRVRADPTLGPVFEDAVEDWPEHFDTLAAFWSSVTLASRRYKGNPMLVHMRQGSRITPDMFDRWLHIWDETTADLMRPDAAALLQDRAARIAESLKLGLFFRPDRNPLRARPG